jgi:glycerol-3-phosphate dehydrogenase
MQQLLTAAGRCVGAAACDRDTQATVEIQARVVVNATGAWSDAVRKQADNRLKSAIMPTKGIHLVLPRLLDQAIFTQAAQDQRMLFLLPWGPVCLLGTTESPVDQPLEQLAASQAECAYLLTECQRLLPNAAESSTVLTTYAGARPLLAHQGSSRQASREHRLEENRPGLLSIMGGKYTTACLMAQQVLALIFKKIGKSMRAGDGPGVLVPEADDACRQRWQSARGRLGAGQMQRLIARYGRNVEKILALIREDSALTEPVHADYPYLAAECAYSLQEEYVTTVEDLLMRRLPTLGNPRKAQQALDRVLPLFRRYAGCSETEIQALRQQYLEQLRIASACLD